MPYSRKYEKHFAFPSDGDLVNGFKVESVLVDHVYVKGSKPRRYEYPTKIVVQGQGSSRDVRAAFNKLFNQKDVQILSGYGNPYTCNLGKPEIVQVGEERYEITARGHCVKMRNSEDLKAQTAAVEDLRETALKVYEAIFENRGFVEVNSVMYQLGEASKAKIKLVKIEGYTFIEQNPSKASIWGEKARDGHKIMWVCKGRRYIARVMDGRFLDLKKKKQ